MRLRLGLVALLVSLMVVLAGATQYGSLSRVQATVRANADLICDQERSAVSAGIVTLGQCVGEKIIDRLYHRIEPLWAPSCTNVRQFGAVLDGSTDDTTPFLAAVADAGSATGNHCVFLPASIVLKEATITVGHVTIEGVNAETTWIIPSSTTASALHLGSPAAPVTGIVLRKVGFVQPAVNATGLSTDTVGQRAGTMVDFANCFDCWVQDFFSRNAWNLFHLSTVSGALHVERGHVRTVNNDFADVDGSNDQYFVDILFDYDTPNGPVSPQGGPSSFDNQLRLPGHSHACFNVTASRGSLQIRGGDFLHCGIGILASPTGGAQVEWLNLYGATFDTCTSDYQGLAFDFEPSGTDGNGNPSLVHGLKGDGVWASGCAHGLFTNATNGAVVEVLNFSDLTTQGNSQEGVLLQGNGGSITFNGLQAYRNGFATDNANGQNTFPEVRIAGGFGNVTFNGGRAGNIRGLPRHDGLFGVEIDSNYLATATIVGLDMCGYAAGGGGLAYNRQAITASNPFPAGMNVYAYGSPCQTQ